MSLRVFMHVQHLKGTGHQHRAAAVARALLARGAEVTYATGSEPVAGAAPDGAALVRLPSVRAEGEGYARLVGADGSPIDDAWRERRLAASLAAFAAAAPDVVIIETFPFGRRKLRFELLPLLAAAREMRRTPVVVASLRDVPEPRRDAAERQAMVALAERYFDCVMVHGDPRVVGLERTFPEAVALGSRIVYTGYVTDERPARAGSADGHGEVLVSAGGGAAGGRLLATAVAAAAVAATGAAGEAGGRGPRWRVLVGPDAPEALRALAGGQGNGDARLLVEPNRPDFPGMLRNCAVSVSQAGYNTMLDVVTARARALVVPHAGGGEREQGIRARCFAALGAVSVLESEGLTPAGLARAVAARLAGPRPGPGLALDVGGAARSAEIVSGLSCGG